jgi:hypothetical protein
MQDGGQMRCESAKVRGAKGRCGGAGVRGCGGAGVRGCGGAGVRDDAVVNHHLTTSPPHHLTPHPYGVGVGSDVANSPSTERYLSPVS